MPNKENEFSPSRDWRDEKTYKDLKDLDRRGFAWEYFRRNRVRDVVPPDGSAQAGTQDGVFVLTILAMPNLITWGLRFRGRSYLVCVARPFFLGRRQ